MHVHDATGLSNSRGWSPVNRRLGRLTSIILCHYRLRHTLQRRAILWQAMMRLHPAVRLVRCLRNVVRRLSELHFSSILIVRLGRRVRSLIASEIHGIVVHLLIISAQGSGMRRQVSRRHDADAVAAARRLLVTSIN